MTEEKSVQEIAQRGVEMLAELREHLEASVHNDANTNVLDTHEVETIIAALALLEPVASGKAVIVDIEEMRKIVFKVCRQAFDEHIPSAKEE